MYKQQSEYELKYEGGEQYNTLSRHLLQCLLARRRSSDKTLPTSVAVSCPHNCNICSSMGDRLLGSQALLWGLRHQT